VAIFVLVWALQRLYVSKQEEEKDKKWHETFERMRVTQSKIQARKSHVAGSPQLHAGHDKYKRGSFIARAPSTSVQAKKNRIGRIKGDSLEVHRRREQSKADIERILAREAQAESEASSGEEAAAEEVAAEEVALTKMAVSRSASFIPPGAKMEEEEDSYLNPDLPAPPPPLPDDSSPTDGAAASDPATAIRGSPMPHLDPGVAAMARVESSDAQKFSFEWPHMNGSGDQVVVEVVDESNDGPTSPLDAISRIGKSGVDVTLNAVSGIAGALSPFKSDEKNEPSRFDI